jgi:hypothetical protein
MWQNSTSDVHWSVEVDLERLFHILLTALMLLLFESWNVVPTLTPQLRRIGYTLRC